MRNSWMLLTISVFCALVLSAVGLGAQAPQPASATYTWFGELVNFDANGPTVTVKSWVVGEALEELPQFKAGDRVVLTWSGYDNYAHAISHVVRYEAGKQWNEPFTFPVEFVAFEAPRQYLTFKFRAPAASVQTIKALKPGEWITATSRHRASSEAEAIAALKAYASVPSRTGTN